MEDLVSCLKHHRYAAVSRFVRDADVLDLGCGTGEGSAAIAPLARSVTGVDDDREHIDGAQASFARDNARFVHALADALPLDAKSVDVVLVLDSFERYADQPRVLREIARVLRWEGRLVIAARNRAVFNDRYVRASNDRANDLYLAEFREMLGDVFPEIRLYGQRFVSASAIAPLRDGSGSHEWQPIASDHAFEGIAADDADGFIAVCGRSRNDAFLLTTLHTESAGIQTLEQRAARERIAHLDEKNRTLEGSFCALEAALRTLEGERDRQTREYHAAHERIAFLEETLRALERETATAVERLERLAGGIEERLSGSAVPTLRG